MNDQELEILIHRIVGGWAIDYHVLMTAPALDAIETHLFEQFSIAIRAAASKARRSERERIVKLLRDAVPPRYTIIEDLIDKIRALD